MHGELAKLWVDVTSKQFFGGQQRVSMENGRRDDPSFKHTVSSRKMKSSGLILASAQKQ